MQSHEGIWTKEYFDSGFKDKDPWYFFSSSYERRKYLRQLVLIKDRISTPKSILEIGCAEGAHTSMILDIFPEAEIVGVDISSVAIKRAIENVKSDKVSFITADIINYINNIEDNFFDIIIWSESVYYIGDRLTLRDTFEYFDKIISKLKSGGLLCMANIIDQKDAPETPLTRRPIIKCYFSLLSHFTEPIHSSSYLDYKLESNKYYEYQIWIFEKK